MKKLPSVSIIIPLYVIGERFFKDLKNYQKLDYSNFEILVVCDQKVKLPNWPNIKLIPTHLKQTGPAEKRDLGIQKAKGEICAFIDDDAYPRPDWLKRAVIRFNNQEIVAVGGPGITPPEDNFWQKVGGRIIESYLCSGGVQYRFLKAKKRFVVDFPAYNLLVRTDVLKNVGGYGCTFYGGEDTFLCLKLIEHGRIFYDPKVVVYHHRRALIWPHLKQISNVGWHRGYFFKKFPKTSRRPIYLLPSILTIGLFGGVLLAISWPEWFLFPVAALFLTFWMIGSWSIYRHKVNLLAAIIGGLGIMATHISYGLSFIRGLFIKDLKR